MIATLENGTFAEPMDEWSLLGYCTVEKLPFEVDREIYDNHRVKTLNDFKNGLVRAIDIKTK